MDRFVVMVDAGYLLRQAIEVLSQRASSSRADLELPDPAALVDALLAKSRATLALAGKELLRVYWYDGVPAGGPTAQQRALIDVDDLQLRTGTIDARGQQKGVDSLILTDLIELATHRAICDAILVTGDGDLVVGIDLAQRRGVRIAVLGVEEQSVGVPHHQSFDLTSRADRVARLGLDELAPLFRYAPASSAVVPDRVGAPSVPEGELPAGGLSAAASSGMPAAEGAATAAAAATAGTGPLDAADRAQIAAAVQAFIAQQAQRLAGVIDPHSRRIDAAIDATLLHHVFVALGRGKLNDAERVFARHVFRMQLHAEAAH